MTVVRSRLLSGSAREHIAASLPQLIPSERRVAEAVLEHSQEVPFLTTGQLAALAKTSPATVVRTCQSLGMDGYQHLRLLMLRDSGENESDGEHEALDPMEDTVEPLASRMDRFRASAVRSFSTVFASLDHDRLAAAANAMAEARRLIVVAHGASAASAEIFALRLTAEGLLCVRPSDPVRQLLLLSQLGREDCAFFISGSGMNRVTIDAIRAVAPGTATRISLTGNARSPLTENSDISLIAGGSPHLTVAQVVNATLSQLLVVGVIADEVLLAHGSVSSGNTSAHAALSHILPDSER